MQGFFASSFSLIRHVTEVMPLTPRGREEVNYNVPFLDESVSVSLVEMAAGLLFLGQDSKV